MMSSLERGGGRPKTDNSTDKLRERDSGDQAKGVKWSKIFADITCTCPIVLSLIV